MNLDKMKLAAIPAETGLMAMCLWALLFSLSAGAADFPVREYGAVSDDANSANPFHNCKGFTFNACTFDDCDGNK